MLKATQKGIPNDSTFKGLSAEKTTSDCSLNHSKSQIETAQYIADMILELRNMAKSSGLYGAMVPLEYAYYEAFAVANRVRVSKEEIDRLNRLGDDAHRSEAPVIPVSGSFRT